MIPRFITTQVNIFKVEMPLHWSVHLLWWWLFSWKSCFQINGKSYNQCCFRNNQIQHEDLEWLTARMGWQLRDWTSSLGSAANRLLTTKPCDICWVTWLLWTFSTPSIKCSFALVFLKLSLVRDQFLELSPQLQNDAFIKYNKNTLQWHSNVKLLWKFPDAYSQFLCLSCVNRLAWAHLEWPWLRLLLGFRLLCRLDDDSANFSIFFYLSLFSNTISLYFPLT